MMAVATMACYGKMGPPPPMINRIEADTEVQGRVYVNVVNIATRIAGDIVERQYVSDDYGATWTQSAHTFSRSDTSTYAMEVRGETLYMDSRSIWSFPRPVFRSVFYDESRVGKDEEFRLPSSIVSNSLQGDVVYIAMGTEGVLVGQLDENKVLVNWKLSAIGIDVLNPLLLTITKPLAIFNIVLLILVLPPFALIHASLLQRVWVYLLPPIKAWQMALTVTAGFVVLAIIGIVFWLTNERTDLYQVLGGLTIIIAIIGVAVTLKLARKAQMINYTVTRLVFAILLVSIIVPIGAAAIFRLWWLVFAMVFSYWAYHRVFWRYIKLPESAAETRVQRGHVDQLAVEMIMSVFALFIAIVAFALVSKDTSGVVVWFSIPVFVAGIFVISDFFKERLSAFDLAFRDKSMLDRVPLELRMHTLYWIILTVIASVVTFIAQSVAQSWFSTLIKIIPTP